jgi:hypothetical protein
MGNNSSSKTSGYEQNLNETDIELIRKTWNMMISKCSLKDLGNGLMTRALIEHKELKQLWRNSLLNKDENDFEIDLSTKRSLLMKSHGERVFETIMLAVNSINDLDQVAKKLNQLGYDHFKYGTKIDHLEVCLKKKLKV